MAVATTVVGSYPKPPDEGEPFVLRKTLHALERGEATPEDVVAAQDDLVRAVIAEQEAAGIDIVTDGQARWDDIVTPFARHMAGFEIGGLRRFFDNNVYYRRPVCTGPVEWRGPSSVEAFRFAAAVAARPVKAVIPGPVTFALLSVDEYYGSPERLAAAIAEVLAQEAFELEAAGCRHLQVDEPALLGAPELLGAARAGLGRIASGLQRAEVTLATYFGDAKRLGAELFELPADFFALDLVSGPANAELIDDLAASGKGLQAGVVDARNTLLEDPGQLAAQLEALVAKLGAERLRLAPSCGLEFLPREKARAKLQRLAEVAAALGTKSARASGGEDQ
jgi:5-methyltetrahydropteroyltriglutamate--homocysteine methyltransferase